MPQSAIGPGMGVFSRYKAVLEADDSPMSVKTALDLVDYITADVRESLGPQLAALTDDRLSHPATWAAYVHHGTWPSRPDEK